MEQIDAPAAEPNPPMHRSSLHAESEKIFECEDVGGGVGLGHGVGRG
jgi:hypothetical protein